MSDATQCNTPNAQAPAPALAAPLATWRAGFLLALGETGNVSAACRAVSIERSTAYRAKGNDPSFAEEWAVAEHTASDALILEARKLATGYYVSYKFDKEGCPLRHPETGEPYTERVVHPGLLQTLMKAYRPDLFGDKLRLDTGTKAPAYDLSRLTPEELAALEVLTHRATPPSLPA